MKKIFILFLLALTSCEDSYRVRVLGRVSFNENSGCTSPVNSKPMTWAECHALKKRFNPETGEPITSNIYEEHAQRPLLSTIRLSLLNPEDPTKVCGQETVQTDEQGYFDANVPSCGATSDVLVAGQVILSKTVIDQDDKAHSIVSLWRESLAITLFDFTDPSVTNHYAYTEYGGARFSIPTLGFTASQVSQCEADMPCESPTYNLGGIELLAESELDDFGYLRQLLSAYSSVVVLHEKLQEKLKKPTRFGHSLDYFKVFAAPNLRGWGSTYRVYFDSTGASASRGGMNLFGPNREFYEEYTLSRYVHILSGLFTLGHEFGHSIHAALAPSTFMSDYAFANPMKRANGEEYNWGHHGGQYQELSTSLSEGIASTMGQFLMTECKGGITRRPERTGGAINFIENMWNGDVTCDPADGCGYHHIRWHLTERGLREGTPEFTRRLTALRTLTQLGVSAAHQGVISNSEVKISEWGCDLLDDESSTTHASRTVGRQYLDDFTYLVGQSLDGTATSPLIRSYPSTTPLPEEAHLNLSELLTTLDRICPDCGNQVSRGAQWGQAYNSTRLSIHESPLSAQSFMKQLVGDGYITQEQANPVLQSNAMELLKE